MGGTGRQITVQGWPKQKAQDLAWKTTKARGMSQMVEGMPKSARHQVQMPVPPKDWELPRHVEGKSWEKANRRGFQRREKINFVNYCCHTDKIRTENYKLNTFRSFVTWTRAISTE
jgi:hypothetical protein